MLNIANHLKIERLTEFLTENLIYAVGVDFIFTAAAYNLARLPKIAGGAGMSTPANRQLVGRWRVVKAGIWDRDHLRPLWASDPHDHRPRSRRDRLRRSPGRP